MSEALKSTLTFSDEQAMLLDTAVDFFRKKSPSAYVRQQIETPNGFEAPVWQEMVDLGWLSVAIPEDFGGMGLGLAEAVTIVEPMGRHLFASPYLSTQLFVQGLSAGSTAQQEAHLPRIAEGTIATVALSEQNGSWDLTDIHCEVGADGTLTGAKTFVCDAQVADSMLVSVRANGKPALAIVASKDLPASALARETIIDETRRSYRVDLTGVAVTEDQLITGQAAQEALTRMQTAALLLVSAESAGGINGTLDVILEYLKTRTQFGRRIGGYQALKHPSVDILIGLERTRSHVYHAASLLAAGEDALVALRMAKAEAAQSFAFAGDRAIQFHGGFGFTYECDAQLYLRRALWCQYAFGDAPHHRKHLAEALLG